MAPSDPIRLVIVDGDAETAAALKSLLRGRIERPYTIDVAADVPSAGADAPYDVLLLEIDTTGGGDEARVVARIRHAIARGGMPPLVLLGGTRDRALEPILLSAGAADLTWKEELSAPLLESQIRHALGAREHALLQKRFHESQRIETVGRLAGGVAHEFNNILTAIVGFGSLLTEQVKGNAEAEASVAEVLKAGDRAAVLTRQLLAFGRRQVLHPVRLQLDETVEGISALISRLAGDGVDVKIVGAAGLPAVRADRAQIESALLALVMNAREAMAKEGRLTIEMGEVALDDEYCATQVDMAPGRYVRLDVSDTGGGIPPEARERVFEPFFTTKEMAGGGGLGLAAVHGIVRQSGGHILVYSEEGAGTTFRIYLPVDLSAPTQAEAPSAAKDVRGTGTILLVEDADGIRRLAAQVIRRAGYSVIEAAGPAQALEAASSHDGDINLLLTDLMMPGGNGVELAGRLTKRRPRLNVLYMSGYTDDAAIRNGMLTGDAAFLQKPFTPRQLLRKVRQALEVGA